MTQSVSIYRPRVWSDIDGTVTRLPRNWDVPRRATKEWLVPQDGYVEFLRGLTGDGVIDFVGMVSRRPDLRRRATRRLISRVPGLSELFDDYPYAETRLMGSESLKASVIVGESQKTHTVVIEDRPHRLGRHIIQASRKISDVGGSQYPIILAAVNHPETETNIGNLAEYAAAVEGVSVRRGQARLGATDPGIGAGDASTLVVSGPGYWLGVVRLPDYSAEAGTALRGYVMNVVDSQRPE